jgi:hypothetical protein
MIFIIYIYSQKKVSTKSITFPFFLHERKGTMIQKELERVKQEADGGRMPTFPSVPLFLTSIFFPRT